MDCQMDRNLIRKLVRMRPEEGGTLCSIIHHQGSVPRKDYPMMLVTRDGESVGTVGGGKLEHGPEKSDVRLTNFVDIRKHHAVLYLIGHGRVGHDGTDVAREHKGRIVEVKVELFDTDMIAGTENLSAPGVPDGEREVTEQMRGTVFTPTSIGRQHNIAVGYRARVAPPGVQFSDKLYPVIKPHIQGQHIALVAERSLAGCRIKAAFRGVKESVLSDGERAVVNSTSRIG